MCLFIVGIRDIIKNIEQLHKYIRLKMISIKERDT